MSDALDRLFDTEGRAFALPGGETLAAAGEPLQGLYRLDAGRLAEVDTAAPGGFRITAVHRPGALIGAARLLDNEPHETTLTALRDTNLTLVPVEEATAALRRDPEVLAAVARAALTRLGAAEPEDHRKASILGFVAVCDSVPMRSLAERLAAAMRALGARCVVVGSDTAASSPADLSRMEAEHDFVLMAAERQEFVFTAFCGRQIDRLILVGAAASPLLEGPCTFAAVAIQKHRLMDFILVQPAGAARPTNSDRWLSAAPASRLFQIRDGDAADLERLARIYAGRSLGLALSGGGARAYAHVGVARALRELGVAVDFVAGTSMGAVIAGGMAMGWGVEEMDERIRDAFVVSSPLSDIAFPLLAMTRGAEVDRRLEKHFGDVEISDLWRPFLCVSTDLSTGGTHVHRRGLLRRAVRASLSLPGVLPPVVEDGHVLVDGALVGNLPAATGARPARRRHHRGGCRGGRGPEAGGPDAAAGRPAVADQRRLAKGAADRLGADPLRHHADRLGHGRDAGRARPGDHPAGRRRGASGLEGVRAGGGGRLPSDHGGGSEDRGAAEAVEGSRPP